MSRKASLTAVGNRLGGWPGLWWGLRQPGLGQDVGANGNDERYKEADAGGGERAMSRG